MMRREDPTHRQIQAGYITDATAVVTGPAARATVINIYHTLPPEEVAVHRTPKEYLRVLVVISALPLHRVWYAAPLHASRGWQSISTGCLSSLRRGKRSRMSRGL